MTHALRRLALPFALVAPAAAHAQLIDDVDFRRDGNDAVLQVRFVAPVQYRRALVARSGDSVQVIYDLVSQRESLSLVPSERRVTGGGAMPDFIVSDESPARENLNRRLAIRLSKAVPFKVRAGKGDRLIEVVLPGLGTAIPASVQGKGGTAPPTSGFQITLQQSDSPNVQLDTPIPAALQRYQVFTAPRQVDGRTVHEVSIGYFETLVEAEAARQQLLKRFPDATLVALAPPPLAAPTPAPAPAPAAAPAPVAAESAVPSPVPASAGEVATQAAALLAAAKAADAAQDSATALDKLNVLLNLPSNPSTREAQALAGDIRAKTGDVLRARAEYETFLQLYPTGPDADRVRTALARLPAAAPAPARTAEAKAAPAVEPTSTLTGSVGAFYYGGASKVRTQEFLDSPISGLPPVPGEPVLDSGVDQSLLLTNVDVNWRYRDADTDMRFVFRDAYSADLKYSDKSKNRMSALYFEHRSLSAGTQVRLGRQSPTGGGVLNRYDGVQAAYTFVPKWRVNVAAGVPTEKLLDSKRSFYGVWVDADALTPQLSGSLYYNKQLIDSETDRSAIGTELRFFSGGVSANGILDYDEAIKGVNIASLQGTWQMEDNSVVNVLLDRRKTPLLALGNALFFQDPSAANPATSIKDLLAGSTLDALRRVVRATTSNTIQGLLGATTPINANWQVGADIRLTDVGEIPPVAVILPNGQGRNRNHALGGQLIGTNLYSQRDTHVISASWQRGTSYGLGGTNTLRYSGKLISYNNSSQVSEELLLEPSLRFYLQNDNSGVKLTRWSPGLRATYRVLKQVAIESELSGEYSKSSGPSRTETANRLFYYLGGRYDF
ncbi:MAG: tetratricopeptide repeat protein [Piscinibacter sp.]